MTPQELDEYVKVREKTLLERYDDALMQLGKMEFLNHERIDEVFKLTRRGHQLMTNIKKLKNQLAKAKEGLQNYQKHILYLSNVIERAREISPEVCARIKEIQNEEFARIKTNE